MSTLMITTIAGKYKKRKRVGRGNGSGYGKTSGRGHNGQGSRAGGGVGLMSEGGQMPLFRRLPKRGFNNANFAVRYEIVNVSQLDCFEEGTEITSDQLCSAGLIDDVKHKIKILGDGELTKKLNVTAHKFSKSAEQKIVALGGAVKVV